MERLKMILHLLFILLFASPILPQGNSGVPPGATGPAIIVTLMIIINVVPQAQMAPDGVDARTALKNALEAELSMQTFGGLTPSLVQVTISGDGPFEADVMLFFNEEVTQQEQATIYQDLGTSSSNLDSVIEMALQVPNVNLDVVVTFTCGTDTQTFGIDQQTQIAAFLTSCDCNTSPRIPSCSPQDVTTIILDSLIASVDLVLSNVEQQQLTIQQQAQRIDALEDLLEAEVNDLEGQIQALLGADQNLTGLSSTLLGGIQELRNEVQGQQNQIQMLQGQNQLQEIRLEDLDSLSSTGWALGIAGTVFGALAVLLMAVICVCLCCPGCRMPFFTSPSPLGPALPVSPIARPVINGPVCRRPLVPAACNMARFGVGRMHAGPLYGGYYR